MTAPEPDDVFDARLARMEAAPPVDIVADVREAERVEAVARAISDVDHAPEHGSAPPWNELFPEFQDHYRRLARAALAAMPPADEALREVLAPGDPDARMHAYYYGFERTGVSIIDAILSAVATAGKAYHGTDMWADEDQWTTPSHEARIQAAANEAAARLRAVAGPRRDEEAGR